MKMLSEFLIDNGFSVEDAYAIENIYWTNDTKSAIGFAEKINAKRNFVADWETIWIEEVIKIVDEGQKIGETK